MRPSCFWHKGDSVPESFQVDWQLAQIADTDFQIENSDVLRGRVANSSSASIVFYAKLLIKLCRNTL